MRQAPMSWGLPLNRGYTLVGFVVCALALLVCFSWLTPSNAQDNQPASPEKPEEPDLGFRFNPFLFEAKPENLATLALGSSLQPMVGPWLFLECLYAGEEETLDARPAPRLYAVWTLQGIFSTFKGRQLGAVAMLPGLGALGGPGALAVVSALQSMDGEFWFLLDTDQVQPMNAILMERIRDERGIPGLLDPDDELDAYFDTLVKAGRTSEKAFRAIARTDLDYPHLLNQPIKHRGEIVRIEGRLFRLTRFDPPNLVRDETNITDIYEGWIFEGGSSAKPYCVLFTELPRNLRPAKKMDVPVSFTGYFYKKYRYEAADNRAKNKLRDAPLLIGRTLEIEMSPPVRETDWARYLGPLFLGIIVTSVGSVLVLAWWFQRTDRRIRERLKELRQENFVAPPPDSIPLAHPVGPLRSGYRPGASPEDPSPGYPSSDYPPGPSGPT